MSQVSYNSKELLSTLVEIEDRLETVLNKNYPKKEFYLTEDTDEALEKILQYQTIEDDNAGYISTELAFFYLRKELEKTIDIVVISNDLRAYYDYSKQTSLKEPEKEVEKKGVRDILIGTLIGIAITTIIFLFI